jgi:methionine sulfoxide reductase heme-binding subunit
VRYTPILLGGLLAFLAIWVGHAWGVGAIDQAQLAARYTARAAFPFFLVAYCASSLTTIWPSGTTRALLRTRRQWGLGFALAHFIHLWALVTFYSVSGREVTAQTVAGGGLAYVMIVVMALTSNNWSMHKLGRRWKWLHRFGIHWIWFIFTFSYLGRVIDPAQFSQGAVQFALCLLALGLRITAFRKKRALRTHSS